MAEAATPLLHGLPDEITIWEILVRLPPKSLLRCRAVCPAWRRATSARDFLLAHHGQQPSLPIVCYHEYGGDHSHQNFLTFDHRAADAQVQHVARLDEISFLVASCDGLFILSGRNRHYSILNPATRQYARLQQIDGLMVLGMYQHGPTGEYRLLLYRDQITGYENPASDGQHGSYVFALGSGQPPRRIGCPEAEKVMFHSAYVLFRGSLHCHIEQQESGSNMILVFDTTAESFRQMRAPVVPGRAGLFEMNGMLGMSSFDNAETIIDIWVLQDYGSEVWTYKCRVELPVAEIKLQYNKYGNCWNVVVVPGDGQLLVLVQFLSWLLQVDMDSKLVASFYRERLCLTQLRLKQTLVPHTFFPTLEGYVVNNFPLI